MPCARGYRSRSSSLVRILPFVHAGMLQHRHGLIGCMFHCAADKKDEKSEVAIPHIKPTVRSSAH